jgi:hypothetical protein
MESNTNDYYGVSFKTYEEWECEEAMEEIFREATDDGAFPNLTEDDKGLLTDYAPKLFNTFSYKQEKERKNELKKAMSGLCELYEAYRFESLFKIGISTHTDTNLTHNQGRNKRLEILQNRARDMLNIIDDEEHELFENERTNELRTILLEVELAPKYFAPTLTGRLSQKLAITKKTLNVYLHNLSSTVQDKTITEFCAKIKPYEISPLKPTHS